MVGVAERQWGVVSRGQLRECGLDPHAIVRWTATGRLHRLHPGVYALGRRALGVEGRLVAALFYAGPGAALSHGTAAWWWGLVPERPQRIHVVGGRSRSLGDVHMHRPRGLRRTWHRRLPVTAPAQTLLDIAARVPFSRLRRALAEAEYLRARVDRRGGGGPRPGPSRQRRAARGARAPPAAVRPHEEQLEARFLRLCELHSITSPEVNVRVAGLTVDALWRAQKCVVELDGAASHATPAGMEEDRRRDLRLRQAGYTVNRYTWRQITDTPEAVARDLRITLTSL